MPIDPRHESIVPGAMRAQALGDAERRLDALERQPRVQATNGPPTNPDCRDGTLHVDNLQHRLWVHADGEWLYTPLLRP